MHRKGELMFWKKRVHKTSIKVDVKPTATDGHESFLADLAIIYPVIKAENPYQYGFYIGPVPLGERYRIADVRKAADAIRVAADQKAADALIKEFRTSK